MNAALEPSKGRLELSVPSIIPESQLQHHLLDSEAAAAHLQAELQVRPGQCWCANQSASLLAVGACLLDIGFSSRLQAEPEDVLRALHASYSSSKANAKLTTNCVQGLPADNTCTLVYSSNAAQLCSPELLQSRTGLQVGPKHLLLSAVLLALEARC